MADFDLTAILTVIRERGYRNGATGAECARLSDAAAEDVPVLLAAVEAVLKPHQPGRVTIHGSLCKRHENHRHFSITAIEAADVRACRDCTATAYISCTGCGPQVRADACPVREAITAALSGKEAGDERRIP